MKQNLDAPPSAPPSSAPRRRIYAFLLASLMLAVLATWWHFRQPTAGSSASVAAPPTVAVAPVTREDLFKQLPYPAEFRPYQEVDLHAKVSGYVEQMNVDIGDKVKAGQLLATLEVPELKDDLQRALAAERHAEADYTNAHTNYTRLLRVNEAHANLVAEQDLDTAQARDLEAAATIAATKAEVQKLRTMADYTRITAPFDGVVTRRSADPGTLIQAGTASDTQARALIRVSDNYRLRLDFYVSVDDVKDVHVGDTLDVRVDSLGGKAFVGTISRVTGKVEDDTRAMMTEIEVPNPGLEIVPGMYASVVLKVQRRPHTLAIPPQALAGDKRPTVYVVSPADTVEERAVTLGLETPDKYEILSGLAEGESVMVGDRSRVRPGQKVVTHRINPLVQK
jgi:RND family efflux transporter MFP subunit